VIFKSSDGLRYHLSKRFQDKKKEFPSGVIEYDKSFDEIEKFLNENVHREVNLGAALNSNELLTDHGPEHVATVIKRAGMILEGKEQELTGFELYLLLLSIHFHDIGNIYGRDEHEKSITRVMERLKEKLPIDYASQIYIADIAMTHGGKINGSKNTIGILIPDDHLMGQPIRPQLIAAVLRFADEIAEDNTRALRFFRDGELPHPNEVFHVFCQCLEQPAISGSDLIIKFNIKHDQVVRQLGKEKGEVYLYDEILSRLKKMYCELSYCKRFAPSFIRISRIKVTIKVFKEWRKEWEEGFILQEQGYPSYDEIPIENFLEKPLSVKNGEALKQKLETA
jgi:hypothetical protein